MNRYVTFSWHVLVIALVAGCATQPYDPFVISRSDIYQQVTTMALLPWEGPAIDRKEEVSARYEALITERLTAAGFKVVPSNESSSIIDAKIDQMGGLFDSKTGQVAEEKRTVVNDHLVQEMRSKFNVDAYVVPRIAVGAANWQGNYANWDGVSRPTTGTAGFWAGMKTGNTSGTIPAMSLIVIVRDQNNSEAFYVGRGGIQLIATFGETFGSGFKDIPQSAWFVDPEKDVNAVNIALSALVNEPGPAKK